MLLRQKWKQQNSNSQRLSGSMPILGPSTVLMLQSIALQYFAASSNLLASSSSCLHFNIDAPCPLVRRCRCCGGRFFHACTITLALLAVALKLHRHLQGLPLPYAAGHVLQEGWYMTWAAAFSTEIASISVHLRGCHLSQNAASLQHE